MTFSYIKDVPAYDVNKLIYEQNRVLGPIVKAGSVTLDTEFGEVAKAIYVGSTGDLNVKLVDGTDVTFAAVAEGAWFPIACIMVNTSGTTATDLKWGS